MVRSSRCSQSRGCNASSSWSSDREQDHFTTETGGHELEAPKLNHRGVWDQRNESGHLERDGKSVKKHAEPLPSAPTDGVFPLVITPMSKTSACSPFQMVMQEKTQRFILVRAREGPTSSAGGESLYYLAPKCLYRGEYRRGIDGDGVWVLYYVLPIFSCVSAPGPPLL